MKDVGDMFSCYSLNLHKLLKNKGYVSISGKCFDKSKNKIFYIYRVDENMIKILAEWKKNKEDGFKNKFIKY